jgi:aspartyl-tRNA(Asn)/glutamyl-tRNA(Gln) amidotransferase subunit B
VEEDAGKSLHDRIPRATAVDLNRSGVPLAEIVTGPDFRSPQEARAYLLALKEILQYAGVSDCDMEKGSLRVDANVSVRRAGETALGTKTEVKNINSFAFVEKALTLERERQIGVLESGGTIVQQTMLFDARANAVRPQRTKEESKDYRYFPEPDLPPLVVPAPWLEEQRAAIPELPAAKRERLTARYGIPAQDAGVLTQVAAVADYFEAVVTAGAEPKPAANWIMGEVLADANKHDGALRVTPRALAQVIALVKGGAISTQAGKRVFEAVAEGGGAPKAVAESLGLLQVADAGALAGWVDQVLAAQPAEVARYQGGEVKLLAFFVGQVMKASKGKADPKLVPELLKQRLGA